MATVSARIPPLISLSCRMVTPCLTEGDRLRIRERDGKDFDVPVFDLDPKGSASHDDAGLMRHDVVDNAAGVNPKSRGPGISHECAPFQVGLWLMMILRPCQGYALQIGPLCMALFRRLLTNRYVERLLTELCPRNLLVAK